MTNEIQKLCELGEKAILGKWDTDNNGGIRSGFPDDAAQDPIPEWSIVDKMSDWGDEGPTTEEPGCHDDSYEPVSWRNLEFIVAAANARPAIKAMLARNLELEKEVEILLKGLKDVASECRYKASVDEMGQVVDAIINVAAKAIADRWTIARKALNAGES